MPVLFHPCENTHEDLGGRPGHTLQYRTAFVEVLQCCMGIERAGLTRCSSREKEKGSAGGKDNVNDGLCAKVHVVVLVTQAENLEPIGQRW